MEWWSGGVVEWWSGGVVEWWSGGVVEWWSGGVVAMVFVCVIASPDRAAASNVWISSSAIGYWLLAIRALS
jgi:hypothetical protein